MKIEDHPLFPVLRALVDQLQELCYGGPQGSFRWVRRSEAINGRWFLDINFRAPFIARIPYAQTWFYGPNPPVGRLCFWPLTITHENLPDLVSGAQRLLATVQTMRDPTSHTPTTPPVI